MSNVNRISESPVKNEGYAILIVKDFNAYKFFILAEVQLSQQIYCGMV